jgi:hypothetical protein
LNEAEKKLEAEIEASQPKRNSFMDILRGFQKIEPGPQEESAQ